MNLADIPSREIIPGYHGKPIHTDYMTLVFWNVEKGAKLPEHSHMNEQVMHVLEGEFRLTINGDSKVYSPGDLAIIPSYASHSGEALAPSRLMDIFSPVRDDLQ